MQISHIFCFFILFLSLRRQPFDKHIEIKLHITYHVDIKNITSHCILVFAVYYVLPQNFQNLLTDYTINLVQSMVEQGVRTAGYYRCF